MKIHNPLMFFVYPLAFIILCGCGFTTTDAQTSTTTESTQLAKVSAAIPALPTSTATNSTPMELFRSIKITDKSIIEFAFSADELSLLYRLEGKSNWMAYDISSGYSIEVEDPGSMNPSLDDIPTILTEYQLDRECSQIKFSPSFEHLICAVSTPYSDASQEITGVITEEMEQVPGPSKIYHIDLKNNIETYLGDVEPNLISVDWNSAETSAILHFAYLSSESIDYRLQSDPWRMVDMNLPGLDNTSYNVIDYSTDWLIITQDGSYIAYKESTGEPFLINLKEVWLWSIGGNDFYGLQWSDDHACVQPFFYNIIKRIPQYSNSNICFDRSKILLMDLSLSGKWFVYQTAEGFFILEIARN